MQPSPWQRHDPTRLPPDPCGVSKLPDDARVRITFQTEPDWVQTVEGWIADRTGYGLDRSGSAHHVAIRTHRGARKLRWIYLRWVTSAEVLDEST